MPIKDSYVRKLVYASLFAALTAIAAWVTIPLPPVPITLQTFFVILAGGMLGAYFGALSMIVYLLLGFIGLPVFSNGRSGLGVLAGPTGGYLVGFVLSAIAVGFLVERRRNPGFLWYCAAMAIGTLIIYACGVGWLLVVTHMSIAQAVVAGALPFVPGDILKIIVAAFIARRVNQNRSEGRS